MASARKRVNWTEVKADYVSNPTATYNSIGTKYRISPRTVQWHSQREGWFETRREHSQRVGEKLAEKSAESAAETLAAIHKQHISATKELREMIAHKLKVRGPDGKVVLRSDVSVGDLARVAAAYNQMLESDRIALGADVLPENSARQPEAEMSDMELFAKLQEMLKRHPVSTVQ
jgi:hypothetical protein